IPYLRSGIRYGAARWRCEEVVAGYLSRYEPDFLVDVTGGEGKRFFDPERVVDERAVLDREKNGVVGHGLSINAFYLHAYRTEYRFSRRHKGEEFVLPSWRDAPQLDLLLAAAFGQFPSELEYLRKNFVDVFEPNRGEVRPDTFLAKLRSATPLKVTSTRLDPRVRGLNGPAVFLLDGRR